MGLVQRRRPRADREGPSQGEGIRMTTAGGVRWSRLRAGVVCAAGLLGLVVPASAQAGFALTPESPLDTGGTSPQSVAIGNLNGDANGDLAVANGSGDVGVLLGDGLGGFVPASGSPVSTGGSGPSSVGIGGFGGNANQDLAVTNEGSNDVTILLGEGTGGFSQASGSPIPLGLNSSPASVAA